MIESPLLQNLTGYIGGRWTDSSGGNTFDVFNPATRERIAEVPSMPEDDILAAIEAGKSALRLTNPWPIETRRKWLEDIRDGLKAHKDEIGRILCLEHGKPLKEAQGEVEYAAGFFDYCAKHIDALDAHTIPEKPKDCTWTVHYRPVGVVGLIVPWNFPIGMIAKKLSAALAAGCPSVIKPASETPLTMVALFALMDKLDLPDGMVNLVMGKASVIGKVLCEHKDVPMLSFTGSTEVGRRLILDTAEQVKKLALELGGNAPFIVFDDADVDAAVDGAIASKFRNAGQTCVCTNRFLVQDGIYDVFISKLTERVKALKVGDGLADDSVIGPLINQAAVDKVQRHVDDAMNQGARLMCGGEHHAAGERFFTPTVLAEVTTAMAVADEETFGPVAPVFRFTRDEEAIQMANDTPFGLAAYFYATDYRRIWRTMEALEYGMVGVNEGLISTELAPFGGVKESGLGREGSHHGLDEFTELKYVCVGGL